MRLNGNRLVLKRRQSKRHILAGLISKIGASNIKGKLHHIFSDRHYGRKWCDALHTFLLYALGILHSMNRRLLPIATALVIIILASFAYILVRNNEQPSTSTSTNSPANNLEGVGPTADPAPGPTEHGSQAGEYTDYSEAKLAATSGTRILFFHAPWCPQCRALDASIKAGEIPAGVTIFKVDYDSNQALRQKYGVTIQTTLVKLDTQGGVAQKYVAYDEPNLTAVNKNLLQ